MTAWPERSRGIPSQPLLASRQVWLWGHVDRHHRKYSNLLRKFPCMSIQLLNCAPGGAADRVSGWLVICKWVASPLKSVEISRSVSLFLYTTVQYIAGLGR